MVHSVACRIVSYVFARGLLPVMLSLALVLGPDLGLEGLVLCPGLGIAGQVLGPDLGLEDYVPVNSTDYRV